MTAGDEHGSDDELATASRHKINLETGLIAWAELQPHFASGRLLNVAPQYDLIEIAQMFALDDTDGLDGLVKNEDVRPVTDAQALAWFESDASLWAVVIKPWVLVQDAAARSE